MLLEEYEIKTADDIEDVMKNYFDELYRKSLNQKWTNILTIVSMNVPTI